MIKLIENNPIKSIVIISILMLLPNLDVLTVTIMEARNFITAREMVTDSNWILTTMNGAPRYQKPPLPTWLTAFSGMLLGMKSLFALRLPAALMVTFSALFIFFVTNILSSNKKFSLYSSLIFMTSFYVIGIINEAPWDIFTHGFMLAGIYFLIRFFRESENSWRTIFLAGIFTGLSLMSKGPVSFYALFLPFAISYGIVYKFSSFKKKWLPLICYIILFLAIGGWWFLYVRIADPEAFLAITEKETSNWSSYNVRPFYYYWSFFLQSGIWAVLALVSIIYPYISKRTNFKKLYKFSFLWTIISVVLLSVIPEKKSRYLVPVLFPLAINIGIYIWYLIENFKQIKSKKEKIPVYFNFYLIGSIAVLFPIGIIIILKNDLSNYIVRIIILSITSISLGYFICKSMYQKNISNAFYGIVFFFGSLLFLGIPLSKTFLKNLEFNSIINISDIEKENQILSYSYKTLTPELIWHYGSSVEQIATIDALKNIETKTFGLFINKNDLKVLDQLKSEYTIERLEKINMNFATKQKNRLISEYYKLTKKN